MDLFRKASPKDSPPESPALLFRDLSRNPSIKFLWAHQEKILDEYHSNHLDHRNVAIELPTGSGKTLVGLLIGEFRRRLKQERIAFVCPNRQLAAQVAAQAANYGVPCSLLTGRQRDYDENAFLKYQQGNAIAITTYSGIFNTNPKIDDPECVICDDAHAADNFVSSLWTLRITRSERALFDDLYHVLHDAIPETMQNHIERDEGNPHNRNLVELISPILFYDHIESIQQSVYRHLDSFQLLKYPWEMIHGHLTACVIYCSPDAFEIRPIIPPTMIHAPFANARQRVFMSATLGENGDIERSFGVQKIERIPIPPGWDKRGTGRRLFLVPQMVTDIKVDEVLDKLLASIDRCLVLTQTNTQRENVTRCFRQSFQFLGHKTSKQICPASLRKARGLCP